MVELLIEKGADANVPLRHGYFPHHLIFFSGILQMNSDLMSQAMNSK